MYGRKRIECRNCCDPHSICVGELWKKSVRARIVMPFIVYHKHGAFRHPAPGSGIFYQTCLGAIHALISTQKRFSAAISELGKGSTVENSSKFINKTIISKQQPNPRLKSSETFIDDECDETNRMLKFWDRQMWGWNIWVEKLLYSSSS